MKGKKFKIQATNVIEFNGYSTGSIYGYKVLPKTLSWHHGEQKALGFRSNLLIGFGPLGRFVVAVVYT